MRYYIDGIAEDEDKAATLSVFNATKGREHRQEPHTSRLQMQSVLASSLQFSFAVSPDRIELSCDFCFRGPS